jgi:hypothetical protein
MPRKSVTAKRPRPTQVVVKTFIAEDVRREFDGKVTLVGLYPDNVIMVSPDSPEDVDKPKVIRTLSFFFNISGLPEDGQVTISVDMFVEGSPPRPFMAAQSVPVSSNRNANLVGVASPFTFLKYGRRILRVIVGGQTFEDSFELREMPKSGPTSRTAARSSKRVLPSAKRDARKR